MHFITPPFCSFSYAEHTDPDGRRLIYRCSAPDQIDVSPFPVDDDFVFDPVNVEPEHRALAWERLPVLRKPARWR